MADLCYVCEIVCEKRGSGTPEAGTMLIEDRFPDGRIDITRYCRKHYAVMCAELGIKPAPEGGYPVNKFHQAVYDQGPKVLDRYFWLHDIAVKSADPAERESTAKALLELGQE